jgi:hypothetical protein
MKFSTSSISGLQNWFTSFKILLAYLIFYQQGKSLKKQIVANITVGDRYNPEQQLINNFLFYSLEIW